MSTPKLSVHSTICIMLLPLLSACGAYQTSGVSPAAPRLASVTTASGTVVIFDTLPAPQISGDTIHGRQDGVPRAIPTSDVAVTRWAAASGEQAATRATAGPGRPAGLELAAVGLGAHVRITAPALGWNGRTGTLTEVRGDTLLVRTRGILFRATRVPASTITELEVSENHSGHQLALGAGVLIGGTLGALGGYALRSPCEPKSGLDFSCMLNGLGESLLGGAVGAGLGALLGSTVVPEQWKSVARGGPRVGFVVEPGGRVGLGVSLAF